MTKTEIKHVAQDEIMHWIANAILTAEEGGKPLAIINEMKAQAQRAMKLYGYTEWPGISK